MTGSRHSNIIHNAFPQYLIKQYRNIFMINNYLIESECKIFYHKVSGIVHEYEARHGARAATLTITNDAESFKSLCLIIDMRGATFETLAARRQWSLGFTNHERLMQHVSMTAIIGDTNPGFLAEKDLMESETLRFFNEVQPALRWLNDACKSAGRCREGAGLSPSTLDG